MTADADELVEGDLREFFAVPFEAYAGTPYVSPMRSDLERMLDAARNPLFRDGHAEFATYTVRHAGRPVGRVVAHVHHDANRLYGSTRGHFGFFDCIDDARVARLLLEAAEAWALERGCREIVGNFNLTAAQQMGVVTDGFEHAPYTDMMYNPPHIPRLLAACGYAPCFPMSTYELDLESFDPDRLLGPKQRDVLQAPELTWSRLRRRGFRRLMQQTRSLLNESFADNPMFVPVSEAEFLFQVSEMMWIVDERLSPIVYGPPPEGPVAVAVCIPDLNPFLMDTRSRLGWTTPFTFLRHRLRRRRAVIIFGATRPAWQNRGLAGAMLYRIVDALRRAGYTRAGVTWISDTNPASLRQMERLGARRLHRLHLFSKSLAAA
jgi:GNAT superfamily N-acetyltransferase